MQASEGFIMLFLAAWLPIVASSIEAPIVIAGAGPASLMFSLRFLQLHPSAKIEIYERRRKSPRFGETDGNECIAGDNAFGFGIGTRAQRTLKKIPALWEAIEAVGYPMLAGSGNRPTAWMVNRRDFCAECIHLLEEEYGIANQNRVKIHYGCSITDIKIGGDDENGSVLVHGVDSGDDGRWIPYSLLVGADGSSSAVRTSLCQKGYLRGNRFSSGTLWKALQLPPQPKLGLVSNSLSYRNDDDIGRLLPRYKNRFVLLNFRRKKATNQNPFGATSPEELKSAIRAAMPDVTEFPAENILQSFLDQPAGDTHYMILNKHYIPEARTILLGDAAVGMYSLLGQGCTYALESAALLGEKLAAAASDQSTFLLQLQECGSHNQKEGKALADMNLISHIRSKPIVKAACAMSMPTILEGLSNPESPYYAIARRIRWTIVLSKVFWRWERSRSSLLSQLPKSEK